MARVLAATTGSVVDVLLFNPHFSPVGEMIAQRFGFTRNFLQGAEYGLYFRLKKIPCGSKDYSEGSSIW